MHQRPAGKFRFLPDHCFARSVTTRGPVLDVSRSGDDAWASRSLSPRAQQQHQRLERLRAVDAEAAGRYGSPNITAVLRREGEGVRVKTVAPWMRQAGLRARVARQDPATTNGRHNFPVADHGLGRPFPTTQPPAGGMADISDVPTDEGWLDLATLEDWAPRPIVGGACDRRMTPARTGTARDRAGARHRPPADGLHHSDLGSQYAAAAYPARLARTGMTASGSRQGNGWDHAWIGSWHRRIKKERGYLHPFRPRAKARCAILESIEIWYNRERLHRALGYRTPGRWPKPLDPLKARIPIFPCPRY